MDEEQKQRPVTDYLSSIETKTDSILASLAGQADQTQELSHAVEGHTEQIAELQTLAELQKRKLMQEEEEQRKHVVVEFIKRATKKYRWMGKTREYQTAKALALTTIALMIIFGVVSTILTVRSTLIYSFSVFENLMVLSSFWQFSYIIHAKILYETSELASNNTYQFMQDADGVWRDTNQEKKRYKIIRWLSYIAVVCNIIGIWTFPEATKSVGATILEILFLISVIGSRFVCVYFFSNYGPIYMVGKDEKGIKDVTIVFDPLLKQFVPVEEYEKHFPIE